MTNIFDKSIYVYILVKIFFSFLLEPKQIPSPKDFYSTHHTSVKQRIINFEARKKAIAEKGKGKELEENVEEKDVEEYNEEEYNGEEYNIEGYNGEEYNGEEEDVEEGYDNANQKQKHIIDLNYSPPHDDY